VDGHFADQQNRADGPARGNGDVGNYREIGDLRVGDCRDDANVGLATTECLSAERRDGVGDLEIARDVRELEVPHEWGSVEERNRRDTKWTNQATEL